MNQGLTGDIAPHLGVPAKQTGVIRYKWMQAAFHKARGAAKISSIILHATEGHCSGDIPTLVGGDRRSVSVHWYVERDGTIVHFVQNNEIANHAGAVTKPLYDNAHSLGIEQEHLDNHEDWPDVQIRACANLCAFLLQQYGAIPIVYHKDVAFPAGRKSDPQVYPRAAFDAYVKTAQALHWSAVAV